MNKFQCLAEAIKSLETFPETLENFTEFLRQRYLSENNPSKVKVKDLEWIVQLCGKYHDNCSLYVTFIEKVVVTQFLAECLTKEASKRTEIITGLKANIDAAERRLDRFTSNMSKADVLKIIGEAEKQPTKNKKYFQQLSTWLKEKVLGEVSTVFAPIIGPLWDMIEKNVELAVQSDYDHQTLVAAVGKITENLQLMDGSIKGNR